MQYLQELVAADPVESATVRLAFTREGFHIRGKRQAAAASRCGMRYANDLIPYTVYTFIHAFALSFPERHPAKNMANQSKLQLSLLDMEQHELLLIAFAHTFMQLKTHNKCRKHRIFPHHFCYTSPRGMD